MKSKVLLKCSFCQKFFPIKPYLAKVSTKHGRCCSISCKAKLQVKFNPASQRRRIKAECAFCNKELELQPYRKKGVKNLFCSRSCSAKFYLAIRWKNGIQKTKVICSYCSQIFEIPKWELQERKKRHQNQFFCNRKCFGKWKATNWCLENNPFWKGGWTAHGKGWYILCKKIRKEQNYICMDCQKSEKEIGRKLDIHHIVPARLFKLKIDSCNRDNLIGLCHKCHMKRENNSGTIKPFH